MAFTGNTSVLTDLIQVVTDYGMAPEDPKDQEDTIVCMMKDIMEAADGSDPTKEALLDATIQTLDTYQVTQDQDGVDLMTEAIVEALVKHAPKPKAAIKPKPKAVKLPTKPAAPAAKPAAKEEKETKTKRKGGGNYHSELLRLVTAANKGDADAQGLTLELSSAHKHSEKSKPVYDLFPQLHALSGEHTLGELLKDLEFAEDDARSKNPGIYLAGVIGGMLTDDCKAALKPEQPGTTTGQKKAPKKKGPAKGGVGNGYSQFVKAVGAAKRDEGDALVSIRAVPEFGKKSTSPGTYAEFEKVLSPFLGQDDVSLKKLVAALNFKDARDKRYTIYAGGVLWGMVTDATKTSYDPKPQTQQA